MTESHEQESATGQDVTLGAPGPEVVGVRHGSFGAGDSNDVTGFGGLVEPILLPAGAKRPYGSWYDEFTDELELALEDRGAPAQNAIERVVIEFGEITYVVRREYLTTFATALRDEPGLRFEMCLGVSGVHYPHQKGKELHAAYHFLSITHNRRVRVEVTCPDHDPRMPSLTPSIRPATGTSVRPTTCSGSSSRVTRR